MHKRWFSKASSPPTTQLTTGVKRPLEKTPEATVTQLHAPEKGISAQATALPKQAEAKVSKAIEELDGTKHSLSSATSSESGPNAIMPDNTHNGAAPDTNPPKRRRWERFPLAASSQPTGNPAVEPGIPLSQLCEGPTAPFSGASKQVARTPRMGAFTQAFKDATTQAMAPIGAAGQATQSKFDTKLEPKNYSDEQIKQLLDKAQASLHIKEATSEYSPPAGKPIHTCFKTYAGAIQSVKQLLVGNNELLKTLQSGDSQHWSDFVLAKPCEGEQYSSGKCEPNYYISKLDITVVKERGNSISIKHFFGK